MFGLFKWLCGSGSGRKQHQPQIVTTPLVDDGGRKSRTPAKEIIQLADKIDRDTGLRMRHLLTDLQKVKLQIAGLKDKVEEAILNDPSIAQDISYALRSLNNVVRSQKQRATQLIEQAELIEIIETHGSYYKIEDDTDGFFEVIL